MISLKTAYVYLSAVKINLIKAIKKVYFTTNFYRKTLNSKIPGQFYFIPNPFLMSCFTTYKDFAIKLENIDPNNLWNEKYSPKEKSELNNFQWLSSIDRKINASILREIITLWINENAKYKSLVWETSVISKRIMSWILNADIILKDSNY